MDERRWVVDEGAEMRKGKMMGVVVKAGWCDDEGYGVEGPSSTA